MSKLLLLSLLTGCTYYGDVHGGDVVNVTGGFYKGSRGVLIHYEFPNTCYLSSRQWTRDIVVSCSDIEKAEDL